MSFDGSFIHSMVNEFNQTLNGGRIAKINQPYANDIIMTIRSHRHNYHLLLSANPSFARAQITNVPYTNPSVPTNFTMTLRKYLSGGVLKQIHQVNNDRIIHFHFTTRNEIGDIEDLLLIVEIMARHSNIILINNESKRIIDAIKRIGSDKNRYRTILPGSTYIDPPKQNQISPFHFDAFDQLNALIRKYPNQDVLAHALQHLVQGIGKDTAEFLAGYLHRPGQLVNNFNQFFNHYDHPKPTLVINKRHQSSFMVYPFINDLDHQNKSFQTLSELLDFYYRDKTERERVKERGAALIRVVKNELKKNRNKIKKLNRTLKSAEHADEYKVKGEILTTYLNQIKSGMKEITLPNFYQQQKPIKIQLSLQKSPSENSQWYFKQYRKKQHAQKYVTKQLKNANQEIDYFENIRSQIEIANPDDLDEIKEELANGGYIKKHHQKKNRNRHRSHPEHFTSDNGITILVGKNNLQNDKLTMRTANKNDIWMHTQKIHGSHVIIRSNHPDNQTLIQAATLAAYFSKARESANVPVDYVPVKNLSKPNGAKPGFVIYRHQKTLSVTPKESVIQKLRSNQSKA
ncbi:hypothetical protein WR164_08420 [Philodulcilactobacillus myokoensis]|uniref:Rqc2 homolog RqcH n=1 Tax=Philodulcilactobacillus myokoensis TaxID=2929573 RepID=A0A9W6B1C9_9LACO|nr:NFACT RNA binding domain-containing protein [Philodulcilactobacillus myokoensis]GLB46863.1 hypothetical protein WR164_08420 [Philodulcilactobacillus myokoensis]